MKKLLALLIVLFFISCGHDELKVDVSDVEIDTPEFKRLDTELFMLNENNFDSISKAIIENYGPVYQKYLMNPQRLSGSNDSLYKATVMSFIADKDIKAANQSIQKIYSDEKMSELENKFLDCIKHFKYHFPKHNTPKQLVFCQTGWNYAFAYVDRSFLIGLDMYLGENAEQYKMLAYPQYQVRKMGVDYLLPDVARGW